GARRIYSQKEAELPARIALLRYMGDRAQHQQPRYDRDGLAAWVLQRYQTELDGDQLRNMLRPEIESRLIEVAHEKYAGARLSQELESKLAASGVAPSVNGNDAPALDPDHLGDLAEWSREKLGVELPEDEVKEMSGSDVRCRLMNALDAIHRP